MDDRLPDPDGRPASDPDAGPNARSDVGPNAGPDAGPHAGPDAARRYHHGGLRAALVEAGLAILEEDGLAALTLRAIAARAGVSHAAPRRHFASLGDLHAAIAAEGFRRHAAMMREGVGPGATREERLCAALRGYAAFAERHPALYALMFSPSRARHPSPERGAAAGASYAVLREVAVGLDWPGAEGPERAERTEGMLWSLVHGYVTLRAAGLLHGGGGCVAPPVEAVMPRFRYEGQA
jgi:AcrR family transcriptional regulator